MITLRLTHKLQKLLAIDLTEPLQPTMNKLGDWYANLVPTDAGDLIIFVNEKTLLSIVIPIWEVKNLLFTFRLRVENLLGRIGIQPQAIDDELRHYSEVQFGKTRNRRVLGSMNDFAFLYLFIIRETESKAHLSLSNAEDQMSQAPCKPIDYRTPIDVVKELLL